MFSLLRRLVERKTGSRAAQLIVFEGASDVERSHHFGKGVLVGAAAAAALILIAAPGGADAHLLEEIDRQTRVAQEATLRADQAGQIAGLCVQTANSMDQTLKNYQGLLAGSAE